MDYDNDLPEVLRAGRDVILAYVKTLPDKPGVYRMIDTNKQVLYIGKAKSLKNRVSSYTRIGSLPTRIKRMVSETVHMEFITTHTEAEALLLEANLIKRLLPRYNVLLRDDKSYTMIAIQKGHPFPEVTKTRRKNSESWELYGHFASVEAVERTLVALYKAFLLRSCTDSFFKVRKRPCLQYYIKRCSAPCVGYIDQETYKASLQKARDVLKGKSQAVQKEASLKMQQASEQKNYELAAMYRDQIRALSKIQAEHHIYIPEVRDADILAVAQKDGRCCVQIIFYRNYSYYGSKALFPEHDKQLTMEEVFQAFIPLFYESLTPPRDIFVNIDLPEQGLLQKALSQIAGYAVKLHYPQRGRKKNILVHAQQNAMDALSRKLAESSTINALHKGVAQVFGIDKALSRIEVYDNSHIQGVCATGAMIVAGPEGFVKNAYRKFNIKSQITPGDDYGMMQEVVRRRFAQHGEDTFVYPDLMLIDGGRGQLNAVLSVLQELNVTPVAVVGIAKGKGRIAGEERFFMQGRTEFRLEKNDPVFYYIQRLRDEAHRFAINTHRKKREKALNKSAIDDIPNIGSRRKHVLLKHFGSARAVMGAGISDLEKVEGISKALAQTIYEFFHNRD